MKKIEYKIIDSNDVASGGLFKGRKREDLEKYLASLGAEGWEIINLDFRELEGGLGFAGIAKREIQWDDVSQNKEWYKNLLLVSWKHRVSQLLEKVSVNLKPKNP